MKRILILSLVLFLAGCSDDKSPEVDKQLVGTVWESTQDFGSEWGEYTFAYEFISGTKVSWYQKAETRLSFAPDATYKYKLDYPEVYIYMDSGTIIKYTISDDAMLAEDSERDVYYRVK